MHDREPTLESLALGAALENVMLGANLSQSQLAQKLGRSASYVNRMIKGKRGGRAKEVAAWLEQCNVPDTLRLDILKMSLPCHNCGCRCDHNGQLACCDASEPAPASKIGRTIRPDESGDQECRGAGRGSARYAGSLATPIEPAGMAAPSLETLATKAQQHRPRLFAIYGTLDHPAVAHHEDPTYVKWGLEFPDQSLAVAWSQGSLTTSSSAEQILTRCAAMGPARLVWLE